MIFRTLRIAEGAIVLTALIAARIGSVIALEALSVADATTAPFTRH